jgi:hypothetical protein
VRITLEECGQQRKLHALPSGEYILEYHDATHLASDQWVRLARLQIRPPAISLGDDDIEQFYVIQRDIRDLPGTVSANANSKKKGGDAQESAVEHQRRLRAIEDALSLALGRIGLLAPDVSDELFEQVIGLNQERGVVLVPDTNVLYNGAMHWLLEVLRDPSIWILPLVASITTVQTRDAMVKGLLSKISIRNLRTALRSRSLVNGALGLLERNKGRSQVVEIDPALLRYQKMASNGSADPDQGDVLEDRLIIEGIHSVLRSMRSRTARRVVTSDVNIARVLTAEGIDTLFVPSIEMGEQAVNCLRFDPLARRFVGAPLRALLWELAHAFGAIRLVHEGRPVAVVECYWAGKSPADWKLERLTCRFAFSQQRQNQTADQTTAPTSATAETALSAEQRQHPKQARETVPRTKRSEASSSAENESEETEATSVTRKDSTLKLANTGTDKRAAKTRVGSKSAPITTLLPRASFPQILQLLGALRRLKGGDAEQVVKASMGKAITVDTARRAFEILRRMRAIEQDGAMMRPTRDADLIDAALRQNDLDALSAVFKRFEPYQMISEILRDRGRIAKADVFSLLSERLGPVGIYESERLPRFHVLLGQAWSTEDAFLDGANRPTDRDATDAFETAFIATSTGGLAKVVDLLPRFCELTRMSPWAAKLRVERFVAERLLPGYSFQPAAGGKPVARDEVVAGNLDALRLEPVIVDRLHLGERPVFTVGKSTR